MLFLSHNFVLSHSLLHVDSSLPCSTQLSSASAHLCFHITLICCDFFINPTDAHNYKIRGKLKTIKIPTIAPKCFGSLRNNHQRAISCLAKTTIMVLLCSSLMTWSTSWRHISLCASVRYTVQEGTLMMVPE